MHQLYKINTFFHFSLIPGTLNILNQSLSNFGDFFFSPNKSEFGLKFKKTLFPIFHSYLELSTFILDIHTMRADTLYFNAILLTAPAILFFITLFWLFSS